MTPYAGLDWFLIMLLVLLGMAVVAALRGGIGPRWIVLAMLIMLPVQYCSTFEMRPGVWVSELLMLLLFGVYQFGLIKLALAFPALRRAIYLVPLGLLPLLVNKFIPLFAADTRLGFTGISYVTFRALDLLWAIGDGLVKQVGLLDQLIFLFFFPTISSGPIDRFRRFTKDWRRTRTKAEFWADLNAGVEQVFRGLLFKFVIASYISDHPLHHAEKATGLHGAIYYAYCYSIYLFFDFAGYSAFAVGVSRWFGVSSPENFSKPWLSTDIRDFWNRWHISLSTWFRDHVYMRFLLFAMKRKWFSSSEKTSAAGYFLSFGLMGIWHGNALNYIIYGLYHASLLCGYDAFLRWKKRNPGRCDSKRWDIAIRVITLHLVIFGLWIFSGHGVLTQAVPEEVPEDLTD